MYAYEFKLIRTLLKFACFQPNRSWYLFPNSQSTNGKSTTSNGTFTMLTKAKDVLQCPSLKSLVVLLKAMRHWVASYNNEKYLHPITCRHELEVDRKSFIILLSDIYTLITFTNLIFMLEHIFRN